LTKIKDTFKDKYRQFVVFKIKVSNNTVKLKHISPLSDFSLEVQAMLNAWYCDVDSDLKRIGVIYNSIFTSRNPAFLVSARIVADLVKKDKNIEVSSCNTKSYIRIKAILLQHGLWEELRPPGANAAGLYCLKEPLHKNLLVTEMGRDMYDTIVEQNLKWYDDNKPAEDEHLDVDALKHFRKKINNGK